MIHQAARSFEARRVADQRIRDMPIAVDHTGLTPAQKLESLAVCAIFAVPVAGWVFGMTGAVLTALVMAAVCLTYRVAMWRRGL